MEWVWVSLVVLAMVVVWAFVKVLELVLAWKTVEALEKAQVSQLDLDLAQALEQWKAKE